MLDLTSCNLLIVLTGPKIPERPRININHDMEVILHPTTNQFGPIR